MPKKPRRRSNGEGTIVHRKDGRWESRTPPFIDRSGKIRRPSLYGRSEAEVVAKLLAARLELSQGRTFDADRVTLAEFVEMWLDDHTHSVKASTLRAYRYSLAKIRSIGATPLGKVTAPQVRRLYANLRDDEESPSAVQKLHTMLVGVFKTAAMDELLPRNPMASVKRPTAPKKEVDVWEGEELMTFLASLSPDTTAYALFYTAAFTGMRRGELLGLHWADFTVHPDGTGSLSVRRNVVPAKGKAHDVTTPKTHAGTRRIEVTPDVVAVLKRQAARVASDRGELGTDWGGTEAIFPSQVGTYLCPRNASRLYAASVKRAGVRAIPFHGLRHTHASLLIARGHDPKTVSERLGHTSVTFTIDTYQKLYDRQRRAAAFGMDDLLEGATKPKPSVLADVNDPLAVVTNEPRGF